MCTNPVSIDPVKKVCVIVQGRWSNSTVYIKHGNIKSPEKTNTWLTKAGIVGSRVRNCSDYHFVMQGGSMEYIISLVLSKNIKQGQLRRLLSLEDGVVCGVKLGTPNGVKAV